MGRNITGVDMHYCIQFCTKHSKKPEGTTVTPRQKMWIDVNIEFNTEC